MLSKEDLQQLQDLFIPLLDERLKIQLKSVKQDIDDRLRIERISIQKYIDDQLEPIQKEVDKIPGMVEDIKSIKEDIEVIT